MVYQSKDVQTTVGLNWSGSCLLNWRCAEPSAFTIWGKHCQELLIEPLVRVICLLVVYDLTQSSRQLHEVVPDDHPHFTHKETRFQKKEGLTQNYLTGGCKCHGTQPGLFFPGSPALTRQQVWRKRTSQTVCSFPQGLGDNFQGKRMNCSF